MQLAAIFIIIVALFLLDIELVIGRYAHRRPRFRQQVTHASQHFWHGYNDWLWRNRLSDGWHHANRIGNINERRSERRLRLKGKRHHMRGGTE